MGRPKGGPATLFPTSSGGNQSQATTGSSNLFQENARLRHLLQAVTENNGELARHLSLEKRARAEERQRAHEYCKNVMRIAGPQRTLANKETQTDAIGRATAATFSDAATSPFSRPLQSMSTSPLPLPTEDVATSPLLPSPSSVPSSRLLARPPRQEQHNRYKLSPRSLRIAQQQQQQQQPSHNFALSPVSEVHAASTEPALLTLLPPLPPNGVEEGKENVERRPNRRARASIGGGGGGDPSIALMKARQSTLASPKRLAASEQGARQGRRRSYTAEDVPDAYVRSKQAPMEQGGAPATSVAAVALDEEDSKAAAAAAAAGGAPGRARRAVSAPVCYQEPSLKMKVRKTTVFFPKGTEER